MKPCPRCGHAAHTAPCTREQSQALMYSARGRKRLEIVKTPCGCKEGVKK